MRAEPGQSTNIALFTEAEKIGEQPVVKVEFENDKTKEKEAWLIPLMLITKFMLHEYESLERLVIDRLYGPGDKVLEAGTGIGITGLTILQKGAELVTFDPQEDNLPIAATVFNMNGYTAPYLAGAALATANGSVMLTTDKISWDATIMDTQVEGKKERVPCLDINDVVEEHKITAVHFDVEGAEALLIEHLNLDPINKVSMEVHPSMIGFDTYDAIIVKTLVDAGFEQVCQAGMERNYPSHNYAVGWEKK
ncbi:MAG: FkbM family methyltransferase [Candidatus Thorarchaeota archaeon]|jgi:FkbM family methyltransferase